MKGGDQPGETGRGSMVSNLLLLVLWSEWCGGGVGDSIGESGFWAIIEQQNQ
jgi:hypothetical protein